MYFVCTDHQAKRVFQQLSILLPPPPLSSLPHLPLCQTPVMGEGGGQKLQKYRSPLSDMEQNTVKLMVYQTVKGQRCNLRKQ